MNMRHDPTAGLDGILGGVMFHYVSDSQCCVVPYAGLIDYGARDYREEQIMLPMDRKSEITIGPSDRPLTLGMHWHLPTDVPRPKPTITLNYGDKVSSIGPPTTDCSWKAASVLRCMHVIVVTNMTSREREELQMGDNNERGWISVKEYVGGIINSLHFDVEPEKWHRPQTFDEIDGFVRYIASHAENRS
jgi:hypothetical protein